MAKFKFKIFSLQDNNEYKFEQYIVIKGDNKLSAKAIATDMFPTPTYKIQSMGAVTNEICE